jgi:hypothetical protein
MESIFATEDELIGSVALLCSSESDSLLVQTEKRLYFIIVLVRGSSWTNRFVLEVGSVVRVTFRFQYETQVQQIKLVHILDSMQFEHIGVKSCGKTVSWREVIATNLEVTR